MHIHLLALLLLGLLVQTSAASAQVIATQPQTQTQGIYLQQNTVRSSQRLERLISKSLDAGVNTLVVDLESTPSPNYKKGVARIQEAGLQYVPRITVFADGGTHAQVTSTKLWEERWKLASHALDLGAKDIQLDYIRYSSKTPASPLNAMNIREVLRFFKKRANERGAQLQIDIFGEVSHGPSLHIGQDMSLFAKEIDTVCPMVYPSHYEPFEETALQPYATVFDSLMALKRQMGTEPVRVLAYIELFNYHFPMTTTERAAYIREELRAVREARVDGWLAWSAGNRYDVLFDVLRRLRDEMAT